MYIIFSAAALLKNLGKYIIREIVIKEHDSDLSLKLKVIIYMHQKRTKVKELPDNDFRSLIIFVLLS